LKKKWNEIFIWRLKDIYKSKKIIEEYTKIYERVKELTKVKEEWEEEEIWYYNDDDNNYIIETDVEDEETMKKYEKINKLVLKQYARKTNWKIEGLDKKSVELVYDICIRINLKNIFLKLFWNKNNFMIKNEKKSGFKKYKVKDYKLYNARIL